MKKRSQITQAAVLAVAGLSSLTAMAETATVSATVTVDNSIDFTATGTMNFGTLRAKADNTGTNCAYLTLVANPATTTLQSTAGANTTANCGNTGGSTLQAVGGTIARPTFTIGGVAGFTTLAVTLPTEVELTAALAPGAASFYLRDFTAYKTSGTPGAVTSTIQVDGTGAATFVLGATLATDGEASTSGYEDSIPYSGDIEVEVAYQ